MAEKSLAVRYRPATWDEVVEQKSVKAILQNQLDTESIKNAYLFCGPAGCGKTTAARIFASEINHGQGNPIEMDAASNSGVEDVRAIGKQAKSKSLDSEYKIFIIDECHAISNTGWQAFLKLIEEPPAKSIFIFCTTDPQKIPKTILSRVQRYDFQRISQKGIVDRLLYILSEENEADDGERGINQEALEYIAKMSEGGMRDAISLMDKCLAYSKELTLENVIEALGTVDYTVMCKLFDAIYDEKPKEVMQIIDDIHSDGKDLKVFAKHFTKFVLDMCKYYAGCDWKFLDVPKLKEYEDWFSSIDEWSSVRALELLEVLVKTNAELKWSMTAKQDLETVLMLESIPPERD